MRKVNEFYWLKNLLTISLALFFPYSKHKTVTFSLIEDPPDLLNDIKDPFSSKIVEKTAEDKSSSSLVGSNNKFLKNLKKFEIYPLMIENVKEIG
jgi:hypothetical protein